jgi:hypothetical protein
MRLTIPERNVKYFKYCVNCIAKIGSDIIFEGADDGVKRKKKKKKKKKKRREKQASSLVQSVSNRGIFCSSTLLR